jgi:hypothetical protein
MIQGRCLCGAITFRVTTAPEGTSACHCSQCRRQSGHVWASATVPADGVEITGEPRWYAASDEAVRGFCPTCGSVLFWRPMDRPTISVALGALESPTGLRLDRHIFTADKGDYYDISDDVPQSP